MTPTVGSDLRAVWAFGSDLRAVWAFLCRPFRWLARRPVTRRLLRHPFDVAVFVLLLFSGTGLALGAPAPGSVDATFPHWERLLWGWELAAGSVLALYGVARSRVPAFKAGMVLYVACATFYVAALLAQGEKGFAVQAIGDGILGVAAFVRERTAAKVLTEPER